jgi:carbonic anhydrase
MKKSLEKVLSGYADFRRQYATDDESVMKHLALSGQKPEIMVIACCDSRVDPSLILQCDPGDLFVARNVANIVPPYECDEKHHGTSAALEFGVCYLNVKHLIIFGHSQCGGIHALLNEAELSQNDFISNWVSLIDLQETTRDLETVTKNALTSSYHNCLTFPWIKERVNNKTLQIHRWYFDIQAGEIFVYDEPEKKYQRLAAR